MAIKRPVYTVTKTFLPETPRALVALNSTVDPEADVLGEKMPPQCFIHPNAYRQELNEGFAFTATRVVSYSGCQVEGIAPALVTDDAGASYRGSGRN